jgi:hypothetical protein
MKIIKMNPGITHYQNFLGQVKKLVAQVTDFIFDQVKNDRHSKTLDVLSICGMLTRRFKPY